MLSHICDSLKTAVDKTVSVTCTTGIACKSLLPRLQASTVHSFAGIKDGSGSLSQLLDRIDGNPEAKNRWRRNDEMTKKKMKMTFFSLTISWQNFALV